MAYYKAIKQIEAKLAATKPTKKPQYAGSGLLARSSLPSGPTRSMGDDVTSEIAEYIDAIRKQKEELLNGRK